MKNSFPSIQASNAFVIQPSDTVDIKSDSNNVEQANFVYLHNVATDATVRVLPAGEHGETPVPVTIFLPQGSVFPLAVRRVYNTTPTPPAGLLGLYGKASG